MTSTSRRVVITGIGSICPLGNTKESLWDGLSNARSGIAAFASGETAGLPVRFGGEAREFTGDIDNFGPLDKEQKKAIRKGLKVMCRECQMGVAAAQLALSDAGLKLGSVDPERIGISFGADYMLSVPEEFSEGIVQCLDEHGQFQFARWGAEGMAKMSPLWLLKYLPNMPASHVAIYNDFRGPNNSLTIREASANAALSEAYQVILRGHADLMLVGATGTRLHPMKSLHAVQQEEVFTAREDDDPTAASRPFDLNRRGMVLGEGAGAILIEELSAAKARGATIYGEVLAGATSAAAGPRLIADRRQALKNVIEAVLRASGIAADDVGHIHAHGLSTISGDREESLAINDVFASRAKPVPVVAAKSNFGHIGAAGGMVELIASVLALGNDRLFPVLNYTEADPECPISVVRNGDSKPGRSFINLSVTPQGQAAAAMVQRFE